MRKFTVMLPPEVEKSFKGRPVLVLIPTTRAHYLDTMDKMSGFQVCLDMLSGVIAELGKPQSESAGREGVEAAERLIAELRKAEAALQHFHEPGFAIENHGAKGRQLQ